MSQWGQGLPGGGQLSASPGGIHAMLSALKQPLIEVRLAATLQLRHAGEVTVRLRLTRWSMRSSARPERRTLNPRD